MRDIREIIKLIGLREIRRSREIIKLVELPPVGGNCFKMVFLEIKIAVSPPSLLVEM